MMFLRRSILALCLVCAALPASAQPARVFGVLSLVGDSFLIVNAIAAKEGEPRMYRGTVLHLPENALDNTLAADVRDAIRQAARGRRIVSLAGAPALYPHEGESLEDVRPVLARVQAAVSSAGITHLVLVTKLERRADVPSRPGDPELKVLGLGFYLDPAAPTGNRDAAAAGYLASFACFRVWLVDVERQRIVGYRDVSEIAPVSRPASSVGQLWESLSSREKVQMVHALAQEGAQGAARELVGNLPD